MIYGTNRQKNPRKHSGKSGICALDRMREEQNAAPLSPARAATFTERDCAADEGRFPRWRFKTTPGIKHLYWINAFLFTLFASHLNFNARYKKTAGFSPADSALIKR
jgi:hypothetical protein